jgi:ABC-type uncharacterized transport system substrate-binding protein
MLSPLSARAATRNVAAFRSALRDLGYLEGRNVSMELRYGDGVAERMAPLAHDLVTLKPDVLVTGSQSGALAVHNATRTIPIVTMTPADPVVSGFAKSLAVGPAQSRKSSARPKNWGCYVIGKAAPPQVVS